MPSHVVLPKVNKIRKPMAVPPPRFTYDNEISLQGNMDNLPTSHPAVIVFFVPETGLFVPLSYEPGANKNTQGDRLDQLYLMWVCIILNATTKSQSIIYCSTGNFQTGKFRESHNIREICENYLHANIWCFTVCV